MNNKQFKPGTVVIYVPGHANQDQTHPDCEWGIVSSTLPGGVAVKFAKQLARFGWEGTTSQTCDPTDLIAKPFTSPDLLQDLQAQQERNQPNEEEEN